MVVDDPGGAVVPVTVVDEPGGVVVALTVVELPPPTVAVVLANVPGVDGVNVAPPTADVPPWQSKFALMRPPATCALMYTPPTGTVAPAPTWPAGMVGRVPGAPWEKFIVPPTGVHVVSASERLRFNGVAVSSPLPGMPFGSVMVVVTVVVNCTICAPSVVPLPARDTHPLVGIELLPTVSSPRL